MATLTKRYKSKLHSAPMDSPAMPKPTIYLTSDDLPELKSWKVGGNYKLEVEVEQVSISKDDMPNAGNKLSGRFLIKKVKAV